MRNLFIALVAALAIMCAASCTSCSNGVQFGIEYSLQSDGMANGNVALTFDGGSFDLNGDASYALNWQNTIKLSDVMNAPNLDTAKAAKDPTTAATADYVWTAVRYSASNAWIVSLPSGVVSYVTAYSRFLVVGASTS